MNLKTLKNAITYLPAKKAIAINAKHGVGKSQIVEQLAAELGYKFICLPAGQIADAGDIIGLPDKRVVSGETITAFAPPHWWPLDQTKPVLLFIDEANRVVSPSIFACLFDLVLNQNVQGKYLPKGSRVVAAFNPSNAGNFYQVQEFDPAFLDRFAVYDFLPSIEEWISYGISKGFNPSVLNFIKRYESFLDPYTTEDEIAKIKADQILPSRRSWETVSELLNKHSFKNESMELREILTGIIGVGAAVKFADFYEQDNIGVEIEALLSDFSLVEEQVKKLNSINQTSLATEISIKIASSESEKNLGIYAPNVEKFLTTVNKEVAAYVYGQINYAVNNKKTWPIALFRIRPSLISNFSKLHSITVS
ncbi:MAG: hypothetical protein FWC26_07795 [Fibromonadales bacterium]|nr:hypothetical protein [Fibromonadales bacterium]